MLFIVRSFNYYELLETRSERILVAQLGCNARGRYLTAFAAAAATIAGHDDTG
jgi:hypothetical protein